jgi:hypothetical protein
VDSNESDLGDWFAHFKSFKRKKCLFLIHIRTYYTVVLADFKKKDILELKNEFPRLLESRLQNDNILQPNSNVSLESLIGSINFFKSNNDKKTIATLNQKIYDFEVLLDWHELSFEEHDMLVMNRLINETMSKAKSGKRNDYIDPVKEMDEKIKNCAQQSI